MNGLKISRDEFNSLNYSRFIMLLVEAELGVSDPNVIHLKPV